MVIWQHEAPNEFSPVIGVSGLALFWNGLLQFAQRCVFLNGSNWTSQQLAGR